MLRATVHEPAGPTRDFWYNDVTDPALVSMTSTRWVAEATIVGGRFDGERATHELLGSFNVARGTGTITEERELVRGEVHFSMRYESRVTFQNYAEDFAAAAYSGVVFRGNSFANFGEGDIGDDRLFGGAGRDTLFAYAGEDRLSGGDGNDRLFGGPGADHMRGGPGDDVYAVDSTRDRVAEARGEGLDLVRSSASHALAANVEDLTLTGARDLRGVGNALANALRGNGGDNALTGAGGPDWLRGGAGRDRLNGGTGKDTLDGGAGPDVLTGGPGSDAFVFTSASRGAPRNVDVIRDFARGRDVFDLGAIDADTDRGGDQGFEFIGSNAFGGTAGELRFEDGILEGDTDGNGRANLKIELAEIDALGVGDFLL